MFPQSLLVVLLLPPQCTESLGGGGGQAGLPKAPLTLFFFFRAYGGSQARGLIELELHLLGYATATARQDPSRVCNLHHSSRQLWILDPLSQARD